MSKIDTVRAAMMQAMKDKDKARKDALSLLLSALKSKAIDKRADLTEEEENAVIFREIKQAQETVDTTPADRTDIIEEARLRIAVYGEFVPKLMDEDEIRGVIAAVLAELEIAQPTAKDKGRIMKTLMPRVKGKADGALVNKVLGGFFACAVFSVRSGLYARSGEGSLRDEIPQAGFGAAAPSFPHREAIKEKAVRERSDT